MTPTQSLRAELTGILDQLSHDELRVFRLMGRRMIDIGHAKYGALDLKQHDRVWSKEMAQETADRRFYAECEEIAREDARLERLHCFRQRSSVGASASSRRRTSGSRRWRKGAG